MNTSRQVPPGSANLPATAFRVLITRAPHQTSELADRLRTSGLEPVLIPAIDFVEPASFVPLDTALAQLATYQWLLFTSANAVEAFARRMKRLAQDFAPVNAPSLRLAAIGPATARAVEAHGLVSSLDHVLQPAQAVAESLTQELLPYALQPDGSPTRFLLVRAEEAREYLPETLRSAGAEVTVAPAYRTVVPEDSIRALRELFATAERLPHAITFTSSSSARNLLALCATAEVDLPSQALRISIGPITSQTLRELGVPPHAEAPMATIESLAATVLASL